MKFWNGWMEAWNSQVFGNFVATMSIIALLFVIVGIGIFIGCRINK